MNSGAVHIIIAALASGLMAPVGKMAVSRMSSPLFLFYMCGIAAVLGIIMRARSGQRLRYALTPNLIKPLLLQSLAVFAAMWTLWEGMIYINPAVSAFLSNTQVLFTIVLARLLIGERMRPGVVTATVIILSGLVVMNLDHTEALRTGPDLYGSSLVIASAFFFALGDIVIKRHVNEMPLMAFITLRNVLLTTMYGLWVLARGDSMALDSLGILLVCVAAICGPIISRYTFNTGMRTLDVGVCILIFQLYPFFTVAFTFLILGQVPTLFQWLGGTIIIAGVIWLQLPAVRRWLGNNFPRSHPYSRDKG